ncbi:hypothetical protein CDAR_404631 [Caerostris darwini]|uniref:Uncharacterized protein n=1 Tax=Caerostris darwini TaxID=1538125 RepID=A0AAV4T417_9ARAC|nr:hypothetical protein CDAR_404631 [Caerostris darwini]
MFSRCKKIQSVRGKRERDRIRKKNNQKKRTEATTQHILFLGRFRSFARSRTSLEVFQQKLRCNFGNLKSKSSRANLATAQGRNNHSACKVLPETAGEWVLGLLGSKEFLVRTGVGKNFRVPPSIPKKNKKNRSSNRYGIM